MEALYLILAIAAVVALAMALVEPDHQSRRITIRTNEMTEETLALGKGLLGELDKALRIIEDERPVVGLGPIELSAAANLRSAAKFLMRVADAVDKSTGPLESFDLRPLPSILVIGFTAEARRYAARKRRSKRG